MSRAGATLVAVLLASLLPTGCQNADNPSRPAVVVVTPQPVRGVIVQTGFSNFQTDDWVAVPVQISTAGVADITVDWTFPDSWIYVYFGNTACDYDQLAKHTCPFLISSETQLPKPRVLVTDLLQPGTYYVVLYNVPKDNRRGIGSDHSESVSVQVGLTIPPSSSRPGVTPVGLGPAKTVPRPAP
ncbi:MAG TPA: hypothetical protein VMX54_14240 [Vicinamibacteria bacterium]|nr:hypothetical protein [Vicinamibacteria bacterium]